MNHALETTLEKVGRILSRRYNITVRCKGAECKTDGRTIWLPALPDELSESAWSLVRGELDHETAHILFTEFGERLKSVRVQWGDFGFDLVNVIEDVRVNYRMAELYPGSRINIGASIGIILKKHRISQMPLPSRFLCALFLAGMELPYTMYGTDALKLAGGFQKEADGFKHLKDTEEAISVAESILQRLQRQQEQQQQAAAGQSENNNPSMDRDQQIDDSENSESGDPRSEAGSSQSEDSDQNVEAPANSGEEESNSTHSESEQCEADASTDAQAMQSSGTDESESFQQTTETVSFEPEKNDEPPGSQENSSIAELLDEEYESTGHPLEFSRSLEKEVQDLSGGGDRYRVFDASLDRVSIPHTGQNNGKDYRELLEQVRPHVAPLRQKLIRTLRARDAQFWTSEQEEGEINSRDLHALLCRGSDKVFRQRADTETDAVAVSLLIDLSGSMSGPRIVLARQVAILFAETLHRLRTAHEVLGFTTHQANDVVKQIAEEMGVSKDELEQQYARIAPCRYTVFKGFEEPFAAIKNRTAAMEASEYTPIDEAVLFAAIRLHRRPEPRKLLLVLTDGEPCNGNLTLQKAVFDHLRKSLQRIHKAGIECVAVGMQTDYVKHFFSEFLVVHELEELPKAFYVKFAELMRRSKS